MSELLAPLKAPDDLFQAVYAECETNLHWNSMLWAEEDLARRTRASDAEIAQNKRNIDVFNQERNDSIRRIDQEILKFIGTKPQRDARLSSETPGQMIDRMAIMGLKIDANKLLGLQDRVDAVTEQRDDLRDCLKRLLGATVQGTEYFKTYHAWKNYNSVETNPELMKEQA